MTSTQNLISEQWTTFHCKKNALTDSFGWFLQGILATLAFTCLIAKRNCEPPHLRRSWEIWWYDTSKQGIGALLIHMANVYLAPLFQGDPCTWYIINFLLDSTIGLLIVYIGTRVCYYIAKKRKFEALNFGEYIAPWSWVYQTIIYISLMALVKVTTFLVIQLDIWENVKDFVLSPFTDQRIELAIIILIIPFFVNILIFWVTDNFLMRHDRKRNAAARKEHYSTKKRGVRYKPVRQSKSIPSEAEILISDDEQLLKNSSTVPNNLQKVQQRVNSLFIA